MQRLRLRLTRRGAEGRPRRRVGADRVDRKDGAGAADELRDDEGPRKRARRRRPTPMAGPDVLKELSGWMN